MGVPPIVKKLENGFTYYLQQDRTVTHTLVCLVVKVGLHQEQPGEIGLSHLIEHVAVRRGIGSNWIVDDVEGHQFHETTHNYTVYSLFADNEKQLCGAFNWFEALCGKLDITEDDLEKEKRIIALELGLINRFNLMLEDLLDKMAQHEETSTVYDSLKTLDQFDIDQVKKFHKKWYCANNMGLLIVGNFNCLEMVSEVESRFASKASAPINEVATERSSMHIRTMHGDPDLPNALVMFQHMRMKLVDECDVVEYWRRALTRNALQKRLKGASSFERQSFSLETLINVDPDKDAASAISLFLLEIRRFRELGLLSSEFERERQELLTQLRSRLKKFCHDPKYRLKVMCLSLKNHFLFGDSIIDLDTELQLVDEKLSSELQPTCLNLWETANNRAYIHVNQANLMADTILTEMGRVDKLQIEKWVDVKEFSFEEALQQMLPGLQNKWNTEVASDIYHPEIKLYDWTLPNGMRVVFQQSHDPVAKIRGFAFGGLSEASTVSQFHTRYASCHVAEKSGINGANFPLLGSRDLFIDVSIGLYLRNFSFSGDRENLRVALQMIFLLFMLNDKPDEGVLEDAVHSLYSECPMLYRALEKATSPKVHHQLSYDVDEVHKDEAVDYFHSSYSDPSAFTVVIIADVDKKTMHDMITTYLGSITRSSWFLPHIDLCGLKTIPLGFRTSQHRFEVYKDDALVEAIVSLPLKLDRSYLDRDKMLVNMLRLMVERRAINLLRFELAQVYKVNGALSFDGYSFASRGCDEAILSVGFKFEGSSNNWQWVEIVLKEIEKLKQDGPSGEEIDLIVPLIKEQSVSSEGQMEEILDCCVSILYKDNLAKTYKERRRIFDDICALSEDLWRLELQRLLPQDCTKADVSMLAHSNAMEYEESEDEESEDEESEDEESVDEESVDEESDDTSSSDDTSNVREKRRKV